MRIAAMLLADAANNTGDGRINLLGAGIDRWLISQFPGIAEIVVFLRLEILSTEAGEHRIALDFISADGQSITPRIQGEFTAPSGPPFYRYLNLTYRMKFKIPNPGEYSFRVTIDGREESSCPVEAILTPTPTPGKTAQS